ncbi:hypothetical protein BJ973_002782 [Actinoplanes tereljensis]
MAAARAVRHGRPVRFAGTSGSPVNPIATF